MSHIFLVKDTAGSYLVHHGKPGQKWGERHGPPYPLSRQSESERKELKPGSKVLQGKEITNRRNNDKRAKKNESYRQKQLKKLQKDVDYAQKKRDKITDKFNGLAFKDSQDFQKQLKDRNLSDDDMKEYSNNKDAILKSLTGRGEKDPELAKEYRKYMKENGKLLDGAAGAMIRTETFAEKKALEMLDKKNDTKFGGKDDSKVLTTQYYNKDREYTKKVADLGLTALKNMGEIKDIKGARDWFLYEDQTVGLTAVADLVNKGKSKSEIKKMLKDASNASYEQYINDAKTFNLSEASNHPKIDEFIDSCIKVKKNDTKFGGNISDFINKSTEKLNKPAEKVTNVVNTTIDETKEVAKEVIDGIKGLKDDLFKKKDNKTTKYGGKEDNKILINPDYNKDRDDIKIKDKVTPYSKDAVKKTLKNLDNTKIYNDTYDAKLYQRDLKNENFFTNKSKVLNKLNEINKEFYDKRYDKIKNSDKLLDKLVKKQLDHYVDEIYDKDYFNSLSEKEKDELRKNVLKTTTNANLGKYQTHYFGKEESAKDLIDSVKNLKNNKSGGREEILNNMVAKGFKESGNSDRFGKEYSLKVKTDTGRKAEIHLYEDELDSFDKTVDYKKLANNILPKAQKMVINEFSKGTYRTMLDNMGISQNEFKKAVKSADNEDLFFFYGPKGGMGVDIDVGNLLGDHFITIDFDPKTMKMGKYVEMNG